VGVDELLLLPVAALGGEESTASGSSIVRRAARLRACSFGWWLVLVCSERKVLLAGCWWLICCERKVLLAGG
jgi:hypothetical protein